MPQLIELPNETLEQIIESFHSDDIDSFSICCKHLYALSAAKFPKHKQMKRQYSYTSCSVDRPGTFNVSHAVLLFRAFSGNPDITKYVKTLQLQCRDSHQVMTNAQDLQEELRAFVQSLPYLTTSQKDKWIQGSLDGLEGRTTALILLMLPCLEKLVLQDSYGYSLARNANTAIEELMISAAGPGHSTGNMVLSHLSHVELTRDALNPQPTELIHLFAGLPSMRCLRARRMIDLSDNWTATHSNSALTKLVLDKCTIRLKSLLRILASIAALQDFSYSCDLPTNNNMEEGEPKEVVRQLLQSASHSLVNLDLNDRSYTRSENTKAHFMGSLQGFQVLTRIRVEYSMFVENGPKDSAQGLRTHQMRDVLPASVKSVTLTGPMLDYENMATLVEGLGEQKDMRNVKVKKPPRLEKVFYESCKSSVKLWRVRRLFSKARGIDFILKQVTN